MTVHVSGMLASAKVVVDELQHLRKEETIHELFGAVVSKAKDFDLKPLSLPRKRIVPERFSGSGEAHSSSNIEYYYKIIFFSFLDALIGQMNDRFNKADLLKYSALESALISDSLSTEVVEIVRFYPEFKPDILRLELGIFHRKFSNVENLRGVTDILKHMTVDSLSFSHEISKLCRLLL